MPRNNGRGSAASAEPMRPKAIGYLRVSTERQADKGASLEAQKHAILSYAQLYELDVVELVADRGKSARSMKGRPGMNKLLERVRENEAEAVVVYRMDRMWRNSREALQVLDEFRDLGVAFHSVMEKWDTSTAMGEFAMQIVAALAQLESKQISERVKAGNAFSHCTATDNALNRLCTEKDRKPWGWGPYGYRRTKGKRRYTVVPHEMALVARVFELRRTTTLTQRGIARVLTQEGFLARSGNPLGQYQVGRILSQAHFYEPEIVHGTANEDENAGAGLRAGAQG